MFYTYIGVSTHTWWPLATETCSRGIF